MVKYEKVQLQESNLVTSYAALQQRFPSTFNQQHSGLSQLDAQEVIHMVEKLSFEIQEKKALLSPMVQELKVHRQTIDDLETQHTIKKKHYDAVMVGIDVNAIQVDKAVQETKQNIIDAQLEIKLLQQKSTLLAIQKEKCLIKN